MCECKIQKDQHVNFTAGGWVRSIYNMKKIMNVLFILALGSVSTILLVGIRNYTLPRIKQYQEDKLKKTILVAAGVSFNEDNFNEVFNEKISLVTKEQTHFYLSPDRLHIFKFEGRGLWGMIKGVITMDPDLVTIRNIKIIAQEETPGLGARIAEEAYLDQFKGKRVVPQLMLVLRRKAIDANEVDAISGATMSSDALVNILNEAIVHFRKITRGNYAPE